MKVCIGGTFEILHKGHKLLIKKAFQTAGKHGSVFIGVADGDLLKNKKDTESFEKRKKNIEQYISTYNFTCHTIIKPIKDKYGPTLEEDFDAIIVSPETIKTAEEINEIRIKNNKKPMIIIQIPFVLAKDGIPISTTRIKKHIIDADGCIIQK